MKQYNVRRVIFITDPNNQSTDINDYDDLKQFIKDYPGDLLFSQRCEEGFVCLFHFKGSEDS
jgi:hypothetical protein